jgi:hypothetical protein
MILATTEIRQRAARFAKEHALDHYEMGQAQDFIRELCDVFGFSHRRLVTFEERVTTASGRRGRIDGFFPGKLLIEMKSRGADLAAAYVQARGYLPHLPDAQVPHYILVSDFEHLHLYDLQAKTEPVCCLLSQLPDFIDHYLFLAGYEQAAQAEQIAVNEQAARQIAALHDAMRAGGYLGNDLERYLTRLLFCLFADDTDIFAHKGAFAAYIVNSTQLDGSDLDAKLQNLFDTLNQHADKRPRSLPPELAAFPYINGSVFDGHLATCYFDSSARAALLSCAGFDWATISPAIFGSLFQAVIHHDAEGDVGHRPAKSSKRRELGAHYTSEQNILKAIEPLFLTALKTDFNAVRRKQTALEAFHSKLAAIHVLDPACGCGNFLVIAYRELRRLELDVVLALQTLRAKGAKQSLGLDAREFETLRCDVDQCHGIEIEPSAAHIATVALWLTDHQENRAAGLALGGNYHRLPLKKRANIVMGNALTLDWAQVLPPAQCSYVVGNPPFIGSSYQSAEQKSHAAAVFHGIHGAGVLDFVAAWYIKAAHYLRDSPSSEPRSPPARQAGSVHEVATSLPPPTRVQAHGLRNPIACAFVATNSITQGEQVGILWGALAALGVRIHFAHRTFQWSNDAQGVAAVHCVVIGFGLTDSTQKTIYHYPDIKGAGLPLPASNINGYLVDAPDVLLPRRTKPLCDVPEMVYGSKPTDGGNLLLSDDEKADLLHREPQAAPWVKPFLGADEFINGQTRWCLWLVNIPPAQLKTMPLVMARVEAVKAMRTDSKDAQTKNDAATPTLFQKIRQPAGDYLLVPLHTSEKREFIPIGYFTADVICGNANSMLPNATLYEFGMLCATMHNAWNRAVCGRLESRYRYSNTIVYNNYPWPTALTDKQRSTIEAAAQAVLDARAQFDGASLADLYDPLTMPPALVKAHRQLDRAIDAAYGYKGETDDAPRVAFLFALYQQLTAGTAPVAIEANKTKRQRTHANEVL